MLEFKAICGHFSKPTKSGYERREKFFTNHRENAVLLLTLCTQCVQFVHVWRLLPVASYIGMP